MAQITRRSFFGVLASAVAAAAVLDPEQLLWRPGVKKILIPKPARVIAASALRVGDVVTIEGRYAINPLTMAPVQTRAGQMFPQQFVVTQDVRAGQEILSREVCPRIATSSRSGDWESESRADYFNGEPLAPGDHRAEPLLVGQTVKTEVEWVTQLPAGPERGFVLAPPDLRRHQPEIARLFAAPSPPRDRDPSRW